MKSMEIDYAKIGLKVGLEIHQQLNTASKLFCPCSPKLFKEEPQITFLRRLRPTQSELGQIDPAAFFEFKKGVGILYEANHESSCLVEMDEEPPHPLNPEAVQTVLTMALMMNAKPVDAVYVMRKTVIDGSNTTGFQRTCIIASDGWIKIGEKIIPIQLASLEEDAARKTGTERNGKIIRYRIDRLGIPLVEVATGPVIYSPQEAQDVALVIGRIMRDTGKVMRGLGTIRQDINVSITEGALIEIKGVQELELIKIAVEYEVQRQLNLLSIREELKTRDVKTEDITEDFKDVTEIFQKTACKVIRKALDNNQKVGAVKLPKFSGLLKRELMPNYRLGSELADRARFWGRVGGIFHTDEMPAYGVSSQEVENLRKAMNAQENDAVVFVADTVENVNDALKAVVDRAKESTKGVPAETRTANADGTTKYMRPRPGAARMYPETDIPPFIITQDLISNVRANLPESTEKKVERLKQKYSLNEKLAKQISDSEFSVLFETTSKKYKISPTTVAVFLTETMKSLKREGVEIGQVSDAQIEEIFKNVASGNLAKESVADVFIWLSKNENKTIQDAIDKMGIKMLTIEELNKIVSSIIEKNKRQIDEIGKQKSLGFLTGMVMKEVRGKANPDAVSAALRKKLE
jgi:glutamyl-tRNA(Gln) amidotransferase subunit E